MKIAYLLQRFPGKTDTFIRREIECLLDLGLDVQIISVWKPREDETDSNCFDRWSKITTYLLPTSAVAIALTLCRTIFFHPKNFFSTLGLALATSEAGFKGFIYQLFYLVEAILAADAVKSNDIDHLHNHFGDQSGNVTMFAANLSDTEFSISYHGPHIFFNPEKWAIGHKVRRARFSRAISYFCRSQLMLFSKITEPKTIEIVHCGLNLENYLYRPPKKHLKRLFCSARLAPEKGISILFKAMKELKDVGEELELHIAGDGESRENLVNLANNLGIQEQVKFLGYLDEVSVTEELSSADLFVLPSFAEGLPVSLMEAMAIGIPVIATNIAAISELVKHRTTGLLVEPSNVESLVDAIGLLRSDTDLAVTMSKQARQIVQDQFDLNKECEKLQNCFLGNLNV